MSDDHKCNTCGKPLLRGYRFCSDLCAQGWLSTPASARPHAVAAPPVKPKENVNHPDHYQHASGVECIDVVEHLTFNVGNAVKYVWRAGAKGSALEDLQKASWYLTRTCTVPARIERDVVTHNDGAAWFELCATIRVACRAFDAANPRSVQARVLAALLRAVQLHQPGQTFAAAAKLIVDEEIELFVYFAKGETVTP